MTARLILVVLASALTASASAVAQVKVRTEAIKRAPAASAAPAPPELARGATSGTCETVDLSKLNAKTEGDAEVTGSTRSDPPAADARSNPHPMPEAVARMRHRILTTARMGDPAKLVALMREGDVMPIFSRTQKLDPALVWKETYPDSDGLEALAILVTLLEGPCARVAADTPQETYVWPYVAAVPLQGLTPAQKIDLFRIITGADYQDMLESGRYDFYRVAIAANGVWRFFVSKR
jgi:hypothetical protein